MRLGQIFALVRYQTALLLGAQRWTGPVLLYAALLVAVVRWGDPVLDSLGYAAAALLPVACWVTRGCLTAEPVAARQCAAAAAGPARTHLAAVLTALLASAALGLAGTAGVVAVGDPHSFGGRVAVPVPAAAASGLAAALVCALLGVAVGVLCNRPLLRGTARAVPVALLAVLVALVASPSPANAAVSGLVTGSRDGTAPLPWLPLVAALGLTAGATALACVLASRRP